MGCALAAHGRGAALTRARLPSYSEHSPPPTRAKQMWRWSAQRTAGSIGSICTAAGKTRLAVYMTGAVCTESVVEIELEIAAEIVCPRTCGGDRHRGVCTESMVELCTLEVGEPVCTESVAEIAIEAMFPTTAHKRSGMVNRNAQTAKEQDVKHRTK